MKILFCTLTFGKNIFAGMENSGYNFVKGLCEINHEVLVLTSSAYTSSGTVDGIKTIVIPELPHKFPADDSYIIQILTANKDLLNNKVAGVINDFNPNVVMVWDPLWGFVQYLDRDLFNKQIICCLFHVVSNSSVIEKALEFEFDHYFSVSDNLKKQLPAYISRNMKILPNSIDYELYKSEKIKKHNKVILINGRLSPEKGIEYGVEGIIPFLKNNKDFELHLFSGEFPFGSPSVIKDKIENMIAVAGVKPQVCFLPNIPWDKIPQILKDAYVIVLPSLMESFGIAALEAVAAGTPIITTDVGHISNIVGESAIMVPCRNSVKIKEALDKIHDYYDVYEAKASYEVNRAKEYDRKKIATNFIKEIE